MTGLPWRWEFLSADETVVDDPVSPVFVGRFDAEAWIGARWRELAAQGVAAARLLQYDSPVAPPLPLRKG